MWLPRARESMSNGPPLGRCTTGIGLVAFVMTLLAGCAQTISGGLPPASEAAAERAVAQRGDSWLAIGKRLLSAGEHELAMKAFERSLLNEGPSAEAFTGAGLAAESQGLLTMAARYFEQARDLAPNSVVAHNNLGVVQFRLDRYYPARQAFQAAFALSDGRNELAMRNLRLSENIIAEMEATRNYIDPAVNFRVDRLGSSEFRLIEWEPPRETGPDAAEAAAASEPGQEKPATGS